MSNAYRTRPSLDRLALEFDRLGLIDCAVRRTGIPGSASFIYALDRNNIDYLDQGEAISVDDHVVFAIAPGAEA